MAAEAPRPAWLRKRPPALARRLLRFPVLLYRLRLGRLLGHRFLVLTHLGRKTGAVHRTLLEVVRWDGEAHEAVVMTPWPEHADWYRNLRAAPAVEVWVAAERFRPIQRTLSKAEVADALDSYARKGRAEAAAIARLFGWRRESAEVERERVLEGLAAVAFRPAGEAGPDRRR